MMRTITGAAACMMMLAMDGAAWAHGSPLHVDVSGGKLTVSGGLTLSEGYANLAADPHEDAALDDAPGQKLRSSYPGYEISGIAPTSPLNLEVLSRPDCTDEDHLDRWLWFWNPTTQEVSVPTGDPRFEVIPLFGSGRIQVQRSSMNLGPSLTVANPIGPYLGGHQHLLIYELQNSPVSQVGVYGIFARLTSPGLEPSDPFLLAFRNQVSPDLYDEAAIAINMAAGLTGDFNEDCVVDAADYVAWRKSIGTAPEYDQWRAHFGQNAHSGAAAAAPISVPEPSGLVSLAVASFGIFAKRHRQNGRATSAVAANRAIASSRPEGAP